MKPKIIIFLTMLKMELKLYIHSFWIWGILIIQCLYFFTGYKIFFLEDKTYGQLLQSSAFIIMGCVLLGLFTGIFVSHREKRAHFEEVLKTYPSNYIIVLAKLTAWFIIVSFFVIISIILILSAYIRVGSELIEFWKMSVIYILIYWGLPFLSAGFIGFALDKIIKSPIEYVIAFLIWILTSPFNEHIPKKLHFLLNQGQDNPNASYDIFGGLNISSEIILRHIFFLLISIILLLFSINYMYKIRKKTKVSLLITISILIISNIFIINYIDKKTEFNNFIDYASDKDIDFYINQEQMNKDINLTTNFNVNKYDIELTHADKKLSYSAKINISIPSTQAVNLLTFSLYRGLKVNEVTCDNKKMKYKQDGDRLYINWDSKIHDADIILDVCGNAGFKNFVDDDKLVLSSNFAWYPIPGEKILADFTPEYRLQFRNLTPDKQSIFNIKVHQKEQIYSNLEEIGYNHFEGNTYGATLVFGRLLKHKVDGITVIAPPDLSNQAIAVANNVQSHVSEININIGLGKVINPKYIFVLPLWTNYLLNAFPIEYSANQLFIDSQTLSIFDYKSIIDMNYSLPSLYWFNKYHDADNRVPLILTSLYNLLYNNNKYSFLPEDILETKEYYQNPNLKDKKLYKLSQTLIDLYDQGYDNELKEMLTNLFKLVDKDQLNLDIIEEYVYKIK